MKTTIDIRDEQLKEAMRHSKAKTKRDAVLTALEDYNRRKAMAELVKLSGTCSNFATNEEIELLEMRVSSPTVKQTVAHRSKR
jgi:Arc/MetJ family transcription regulator